MVGTRDHPNAERSSIEGLANLQEGEEVKWVTSLTSRVLKVSGSRNRCMLEQRVYQGGWSRHPLAKGGLRGA